MNAQLQIGSEIELQRKHCIQIERKAIRTIECLVMDAIDIVDCAMYLL